LATQNKTFVVKNGLAVGGASGITNVINPNGEWVGATGTLHGATGPAGANGATGVAGTTGPTGASGVQGLNGASGSTGPIGLTGATGPSGGGGSWVVRTGATGLVAGDSVIATTTGGAFTVTLPATPATGATVSLADGNDWSVNNLTVNRNGSTIEGLAENLVLDLKDVRVDFIYSGTTWNIYTSSSAAPAGRTAGATGFGFVNYSGVVRNSGQFYGGTTNPQSGARLNYDGHLHCTEATAVNFNSLSDAKYKTNIFSIENGLDIINLVRPVSFDWVFSGEKSYGVIAQEIEQILPEIVTDTGDRKTVSYDQLIPFLIRAVQELQSQVNDLRNN